MYKYSIFGKLLFTRVSFLQETVEVEQEAGEMGGQNMIIILNPNGTVNEELMQAHGINQVRKQRITMHRLMMTLVFRTP